MALLRRPHKIFNLPNRSFIIKTLDDVRQEKRIVETSKGCESRRYLLRKDGMGFSFHETVLAKGTSKFIHYKNHVEAVFITKGSGYVEIVEKQEDCGKGTRHQLQPGTMYALNGHERHYMVAESDIHCVCVFVPPCAGPEIQSKNGVFPFIGEEGVPDYEYWENQKKIGKPIVIELKTD